MRRCIQRVDAALDLEGERHDCFHLAITLLADRPDLAGKWVELHWHEWGDEPGREELSWWVDDAMKAVQRTGVPVAFIALGDPDEVLGGVGLQQFDLEERRDRSPWVVGTIVRADQRGKGIGQALMARMEAWVVEAGYGWRPRRQDKR